MARTCTFTYDCCPLTEYQSRISSSTLEFVDKLPLRVRCGEPRPDSMSSAYEIGLDLDLHSCLQELNIVSSLSLVMNMIIAMRAIYKDDAQALDSIVAIEQSFQWSTLQVPRGNLYDLRIRERRYGTLGFCEKLILRSIVSFQVRILLFLNATIIFKTT